MIPSVQFQSCNDNFAIHKDILEKFNMPIVSSINPDDDISDQATQFQNDQILMHQVEFSDSDIAISQDCHSIELETNDEMIASCDNGKNIFNYTIIGNGLILIEGSQIDYDDETKDNSNDLHSLKGLPSNFIRLCCSYRRTCVISVPFLFDRYRFIGNGKK